MSVRMKRAAKALRARYGVAEGVRPAPAGLVCSVEVDSREPFYRAYSGKIYCAERAHVVENGKGLCKPHMKEMHKPLRK